MVKIFCYDRLLYSLSVVVMINDSFFCLKSGLETPELNCMTSRKMSKMNVQNVPHIQPLGFVLLLKLPKNSFDFT